VVRLCTSEDHGLLTDNLLDHVLCSRSYSVHGESGEPVREHSAEEKTSEGERVEDINLD